MRTISLHSFFVAAAAVLLLAGCATSPSSDAERQFRQERIEAILSEPLDPAEFGETKRCLRDAEYRSFRALDDRRILFEGRQGRLWINTLRQRCVDLRHGDILVVRSFSSARLCDTDRFNVADWFDWPWYRRWPWRWGSPWHSGMTCVLGEFRPVTEAQVAEIRAVLKSR